MSTARLLETVRLFTSGERMTAAEVSEWAGVSIYTAGDYLRALRAARLIEENGLRPRGTSGEGSVEWKWREKGAA